MNRSCMRRIGVSVLAAVSLGVFADTARPCVEHDLTPPDVWIDFHPDGSVWITFHGYTTFGSNAGDFCACALNQVTEITAVNAVEFRDADTGNVIPDFSFTSNTNSVFGGGPTWAGFATTALAGSINAGDPVDILFSVNVASGTTYADLKLAFAGAGNVIGTDQANADGSPMGTHLFVLPAGKIESNDAIPAVSEWGLAVMVLLVLTAGTVILGRRRQTAVA